VKAVLLKSPCGGNARSINIRADDVTSEARVQADGASEYNPLTLWDEWTCESLWVEVGMV